MNDKQELKTSFQALALGRSKTTQDFLALVRRGKFPPFVERDGGACVMIRVFGKPPVDYYTVTGRWKTADETFFGGSLKFLAWWEKTMKKIEHDEQVAVIEWASWNQAKHPELARLFAIPNGGKRQKSVAAKLKAEGVRPGVPDLFLPVARNGYHGLFIEMKSENGRQSALQKDWCIYLNCAGYLSVVCYGADTAIETLKNYLGIK